MAPTGTIPRPGLPAHGEPGVPAPAAGARPSVPGAVEAGSPPLTVEIEYCPASNLEHAAMRLRGSIEEQFRARPLGWSVRPSPGGAFEVSVGGRLVFSKRATRRLPGADEIAYHVQAALGRLGPGPRT